MWGLSSRVLSSVALRTVAPRIAAFEAAIRVKSLPVIPRSTSLSYVSNRDSSQSSCCPYMMAAIQSDVGVEFEESLTSPGAGVSEGLRGRALEERRDGEVSRGRGLVGRWCRGRSCLAPSTELPQGSVGPSGINMHVTSKHPTFADHRPDQERRFGSQTSRVFANNFRPGMPGAVCRTKHDRHVQCYGPKASRHPIPEPSATSPERVAVLVFCPCSGSG